MKSLSKQEQGFTLIEIVIVIAIAAALILLVFLAVSGAQKTKRDQVDKTNAGLLAAQFENYMSNNAGVAPAAGAALGGSYLGNIKDAHGNAPTYGTTAPTGTSYTTNDIVYDARALCGASGAFSTSSATPSSYAVSYWSENANAAVCVDNH